MPVMKYTKMAGFVLGLVFLFVGGVKGSRAVVLQKLGTDLNLQLVSTATPTPVAEPNSCNGTCGSNFNCKGEFFCYQGFCRNPTCPGDKTCACTTATVAPTKIPTAKPKVSLTPTIEATPTESIPVTPTENPILTSTPTTGSVLANNQSGNNMTFWFLVVTIGLLAVIIVVQAWPRKGKEE